MSMKIAKIFLTLLMGTILISCTKDNNLQKTYEISSTPKTTQSELDTSSVDISSTDIESTVSLPIINNELSLEKLKVKTVDIHYIVEKYFAENLTGQYKLFNDIKSDIGIEHFRENVGGTLYSVNKVEQGGLLYIFYTNSYKNGDYNYIIQWFYVQKNLSCSNFDTIKEGSGIDDVIKIDPTTQIFKNIYNSNSEHWNNMKGFETWHYLNDGILYFVYEYKDGKLIVAERFFIDNFELTYVTGMSYTYDGSILPIDRIK